MPQTTTQQSDAVGTDQLGLSCADLRIVLRLAERAGGRLSVKLGLPHHAGEDFRQELLLDFLRRFHAYDASRGSLAGFARTVMHHRAIRLAQQHCRRLSAHGGCMVSIDEHVGEGQAAQAAVLSFEEAHLQLINKLSLEAVLEGLPPAERRLCRALRDQSISSLNGAGFGGRSTIYRRIDRLRPVFARSGLASMPDTFRAA